MPHRFMLHSSVSGKPVGAVVRLIPTALVTDRYLALALAAGAAFVLNGIWWGWVEHWNPDQMALLSLGGRGRGFLEPTHFLKPPFHTYLNFFLSVLPIGRAEWLTEALTGTAQDFRPIILWWSKLIQLGLFLGIIYLSYRIVNRFSTTAAARIVALITATSAGFVLQAHFLTTDVPVTLWILASFCVAQSILYNGQTRDYLLAGFLTGMATATKYNGLVVSLAIPIFHQFANRSAPLLSMAFDGRFVAGVTMIMVGFVVANPYVVLNFPVFASDFVYNYITTPVYGGRDLGETGYLKFLLRIPEIVGWPMALAISLGLACTIAMLRGVSLMERGTVLAALGVFTLYFWKFGSAPRVEVRFVLPVVPFLLIATAPFWSQLTRRFRPVAVGFLAVLLVYNAIASYWVGRRFAEDPRMNAIFWVAANIPAGSVMESIRTPNWNRYPGIRIRNVEMPYASGRNLLFSHIFASNPQMLHMVQKLNPDTGIE